MLRSRSSRPLRRGGLQLRLRLRLLRLRRPAHPLPDEGPRDVGQGQVPTVAGVIAARVLDARRLLGERVCLDASFPGLLCDPLHFAAVSVAHRPTREEKTDTGAVRCRSRFQQTQICAVESRYELRPPIEVIIRAQVDDDGVGHPPSEVPEVADLSAVGVRRVGSTNRCERAEPYIRHDGLAAAAILDHAEAAPRSNMALRPQCTAEEVRPRVREGRGGPIGRRRLVRPLVRRLRRDLVHEAPPQSAQVAITRHDGVPEELDAPPRHMSQRRRRDGCHPVGAFEPKQCDKVRKHLAMVIETCLRGLEKDHLVRCVVKARIQGHKHRSTVGPTRCVKCCQPHAPSVHVDHERVRHEANLGHHCVQPRSILDMKCEAHARMVESDTL
mmetsp:Transcript_3941/g.14667  ORF Transcript_3941/g.14667 Transcript_3941/m.14667 type:complete len:385 (+) Transcript_3941:856-2010(+)